MAERFKVMKSEEGEATTRFGGTSANDVDTDDTEESGLLGTRKPANGELIRKSHMYTQ